MDPPEEGDTHTFRRQFTGEDVDQFAALSGDTQSIHTEPDDDGQRMVHGLLTATLPTKIGGDLSVLVRTMDIEFVRPVYTGETITCTWRTETVRERDDRYELGVDIECVNEDDRVVLAASLGGLVWKDSV